MNDQPLIVEYLIIVKQEDTYCDNRDAFLNFLSVDSSISINEENNEITLTTTKKTRKEVFSVSYSLTTDLVPSKNERYFKLTFSGNSKSELSSFDKLTSTIEKIIRKLHNEVSINILWNDISREYAIQGYSLLNQVENLLRRLIANFMIINVGYDWAKFNIPSEVEQRDKYLKLSYSNYLHQTQFSDLKKILFDEQRENNLKDINDVQRLVQRYISDNKDEIPIEELKGIVAISLWQKFFSKDVKYKKEELKDDLDSLNDLRNDVAHNRNITREQLGKIQSISKKIINTLELALKDLPQKDLSTDEKAFQVNTENERILGSSFYSQKSLINKKIIEWYTKNLGVDEVEFKTNYVYNAVIKLDSNKTIALVIKFASLNISKIFIPKFLINLDNEFFRYEQSFDSVHVLLVLRDYILNYEPYPKILENGLPEDIDSGLKKINPNMRLILGYINANNNFSQITF